MLKEHQFAIIASISLAAIFTGVFVLTDINAVQKQGIDGENDGSFDLIKAQGFFTIKKFNSAGELVQEVVTPNLVVDVGLDTMGDLVFPDIDLNSDATDAQFDYLAIGTSSTAPAATQTALVAQLGARLQDATVTGTSAVSGEITVTVDQSFDGGTYTGTITEAGIFNGATAESMLARSTFTGIPIASGDTLTVTYDITIT